MIAEAIFIPAIIMVALTIVAWHYMFFIRIRAVQKENIDFSQVRTRALDGLLPEKSQTVSQHLLNLFEVPVLFYTIVAFIYINQLVDNSYIYLAFAFVIFRIFHSLIHLSYNAVMQRFSCYIISSIILWCMWIRFAMQIFEAVY